MLHASPIPALSDNYIWQFRPDARAVWLVDPGDVEVVLSLLSAGEPIEGVLVTHHHPDHTAALGLLAAREGVQIFAPDDARISHATHRVANGERVVCAGLEFEVMATPGHTRSHHVYFGGGLLFCGDTLFSLGCGRLFEGTPAQMLASLDRLAALPECTAICCTHEYTESNLAFALAVDPDNAALHDMACRVRAQRAAGHPTLPSTLAVERRCNPFLRVREAAIRASVARRIGRVPHDAVDCFAALRQWKDTFPP